jgi:hypothetical protein
MCLFIHLIIWNCYMLMLQLQPSSLHPWSIIYLIIMNKVEFHIPSLDMSKVCRDSLSWERYVTQVKTFHWSCSSLDMHYPCLPSPENRWLSTLNHDQDPMFAPVTRAQLMVCECERDVEGFRNFSSNHRETPGLRRGNKKLSFTNELLEQCGGESVMPRYGVHRHDCHVGECATPPVPHNNDICINLQMICARRTVATVRHDDCYQMLMHVVVREAATKVSV